MSETTLFKPFPLGKFCLVQNFKTPVSVSWDEIKQIMSSKEVRETCYYITMADYNQDEERKKELKKKLPSISVHACDFDQGQRKDDYAHWNGLVCLEYDHLTTDEIEAFRLIEPPCSNIILCGKSCSATGVWMLIEVPNADYKQMKITLETVHEAYCEKIKQQKGLDVSQKVDIQLDLARLRFLPRYDYIFWDAVKDFESELQREQPYYNMYEQVIELCQKLPQQAPVGTRNTTYKENMVQVARLTNNKHIMFKYLPDLGLDEKERQSLINWGGENITPKKT